MVFPKKSLLFLLVGLLSGCAAMQSVKDGLTGVEAVQVPPAQAAVIAGNLVAYMAYPYPPSTTAIRLPVATGAFGSELETALRIKGYAVTQTGGEGLGYVIDRYAAGVVRATLRRADWRVDRLYDVNGVGVMPLGGAVNGDHVPMQPMQSVAAGNDDQAEQVDTAKESVAAGAGTDAPVEALPPADRGDWYVQLMAGKQVDALQAAKRKVGAAAVLVPLANGLTALRLGGFYDKNAALAGRRQWQVAYPGAFVARGTP